MTDLQNIEGIDNSLPSTTIFECSIYTNMQLLPITIPRMVQMPEIVKDPGFNHLFPVEIITRILQLLMPWSWGWAHVCKLWYSIIRPMTWPIIEISAESRTRRLYSAVRRVNGPLQSVIHLAYWQCHGHVRELLSLPLDRLRMLSLRFFGFDAETPEEIFKGYDRLIQLTVSGWRDRAQTLDDARELARQATVKDRSDEDETGETDEVENFDDNGEEQTEDEEEDCSIAENQYLPLTGLVSSLLEYLAILDLEADALCRFVSWLTINVNPLPALTSLTLALDNPADLYSLKPLLDAVASTLKDLNLDMSRELSDSPELACKPHSVSLLQLKSLRIVTTELELENIFQFLVWTHQVKIILEITTPSTGTWYSQGPRCYCRLEDPDFQSLYPLHLISGCFSRLDLICPCRGLHDEFIRKLYRSTPSDNICFDHHRWTENDSRHNPPPCSYYDSDSEESDFHDLDRGSFTRRDPFTRRYPSQEYPWDHVLYTWDPESPIPLPPPAIGEEDLDRANPSAWGSQARSGWAPSEAWGPTSDKDEANDSPANSDETDEPSLHRWGNGWNRAWGRSQVDSCGLLRQFPFNTASSIAEFTGQTWVRINWAFDVRMLYREGRDTSHLCCMTMPGQALLVDYFPIVPHYDTLRYRVAMRKLYLVGALKEAMEQ
ncbi:hypothetical protein C8J56DRAFT_1062178 [Mycena floridula]|nr:hypothetical protein C8J56DRAFT_1062178 [Mycena floridula]